MIKEGDFVTCPDGYEDKALVGQVEHVMTEGMFGLPGSEYALEASMEDPAILVRHFEEEDGVWEAEMILSGHKASELIKLESLRVERDVVSTEMSSTDPMDAYDNSIGKAACDCAKCKGMDMSCSDCPDCATKSYTSDDEEMDKWDNMAKACWSGYEQRGMKDKDGRQVPNCVPVGKFWDGSAFAK